MRPGANVRRICQVPAGRRSTPSGPGTLRVARILASQSPSSADLGASREVTLGIADGAGRIGRNGMASHRRRKGVKTPKRSPFAVSTFSGSWMSTPRMATEVDPVSLQRGGDRVVPPTPIRQRFAAGMNHRGSDRARKGRHLSDRISESHDQATAKLFQRFVQVTEAPHQVPPPVRRGEPTAGQSRVDDEQRRHTATRRQCLGQRRMVVQPKVAPEPDDRHVDRVGRGRHDIGDAPLILGASRRPQPCPCRRSSASRRPSTGPEVRRETLLQRRQAAGHPLEQRPEIDGRRLVDEVDGVRRERRLRQELQRPRSELEERRRPGRIGRRRPATRSARRMISRIGSVSGPPSSKTSLARRLVQARRPRDGRRRRRKPARGAGGPRSSSERTAGGGERRGSG